MDGPTGHLSTGHGGPDLLAAPTPCPRGVRGQVTRAGSQERGRGAWGVLETQQKWNLSTLVLRWHTNEPKQRKMGKYETVEKEHSFKLKIHLEVLCWSIWPPFPRDCLTHCLEAHSDSQE